MLPDYSKIYIEENIKKICYLPRHITFMWITKILFAEVAVVTNNIIPYFMHTCIVILLIVILCKVTIGGLLLCTVDIVISVWNNKDK